MKFETKTITKRIKKMVPYTKYVMEDCEVEVLKRLPYTVEVNEPVVTFEEVKEAYTIQEPYITNEPITKTETIPIVTRQCKNAHGKLVETINEVPLHASGPTAAQLNIDNLSQDVAGAPMEPIGEPELMEDEPAGDPQKALDDLKAELNK